MAIIGLSGHFIEPLNQFVDIFQDLEGVKAELARINDVYSYKREDSITSNQKNEVKSFQLKGDLNLSDVSFKYNEHESLSLKNINLEIKKGEMVAFVGESGSGKSTLAKLISGLYTPTGGTIEYDGKTQSSFIPTELRSQMGVVFQESFVFQGTIEENIIFNRGIVKKEEDLDFSLKMASFFEEVNSLPLKKETLIAADGNNLSGGQRQRVCIARALYSRPNILIFDEATSELDSLTEANIKENIDKMNSTRIIVAHRLSTIFKADKICFMKNGEIEAFGKHSELLERSLGYRKLVESIEFETE